MSDYVTVTVTDPDLPAPVVAQLSRSYVKRRNLDAVATVFARAMDEYLLRVGWDTKAKPQPMAESKPSYGYGDWRDVYG